jgi:hypothetical protein
MKKPLNKLYWLLGGLFVIAATSSAYQQHYATKMSKAERQERCAEWALTLRQKADCKEAGISSADYTPWIFDLFTWPYGIQTWATIITGIFIGWQAMETREASKATERAAVATEVAARASLLSAESLINAERAWVLAELHWSEGSIKNYLTSSVADRLGETRHWINLQIVLRCKNQGRSPAWIESINARMEVLSKVDDASPNYMYRNFGPMEPLGVGGEGLKNLDLSCDGTIDEATQFLNITVIVRYRDPFSGNRETGIGYSLRHKELARQDARPERNYYT